MRSLINQDIAEDLLAKFLKDYNISPSSVNTICAFLTPLQLKKGEKFSDIGKVCNRIGILMHGLLYAAYDDEKLENEKVSRFFYSPNQVIVTSFESFKTQQRANEHITAVEPSYLFCISREGLDELYRLVPEMNFIGQMIAEQSYIQALQRVHTLQALNVEQRLDDFFQKHPGLFNRIQRQHLTSYAGVNRNALATYLKSKPTKFLQ